jgi:hypothetical protein
MASGLAGLSELALQSADFLEALRHIAHDRDDANHFPGFILQRDDRKIDRDSRSVLVECRN